MKKRLSGCAIGLLVAACAMAASPFPDWAPSNGPTGAVVNVLLAQGSKLWAGCNQGLYKSVDGGVSWHLSAFPQASSVGSLVAINDVILAGTNGDGIFRSTDGGDKWEPANDGLEGTNPNLIVFSFTVSSVGIVAQVNEAVYLSVDVGRSWTARTSSPTFFGSLIAVGNALFGATSPISLLHPTGGGVYRSDDGGATWELTSDAFSNLSVNALFSSNGLLYAATSNGIYRSSDQGLHWSMPALLGVQITGIIEVGSTLYATSYPYGVFKSVDRGVTWTRTSHPEVTVLSLTSLGTTIFTGTYFGIYASNDGGSTWLPLSVGLTNTYIGAGIWAVDSDIYALASEGPPGFSQFKLYRSRDSGISWTVSSTDGLPESLFGGPSVDSVVSDGNALYLGVFNVGVYKSTDGGATWFPSGQGLPVAGTFYTLLARRDLVLVAIGDQVFRSVDSGMTWSGSTGLSSNDYVTNMVFSGNAVYAGTTSRLVKSLDGGATWQPAGLSVFIRLVAASSEAVFAVTTGSGVLKTTNGGSSWTPTGLARNDIYSFVESGGWLFASNLGYADGANQPSHVFVSGDDGASWNTVDQGLSLSGGLAGVYLAASDRTLYAATQGYGVQTLNLLPDRESIRLPTHPHRTLVVRPQTVPD
jgi:hypothetical protein